MSRQLQRWVMSGTVADDPWHLEDGIGAGLCGQAFPLEDMVTRLNHPPADRVCRKCVDALDHAPPGVAARLYSVPIDCGASRSHFKPSVLICARPIGHSGAHTQIIEWDEGGVTI